METPGKSMTAEDLRRNMMRTYFTLRLGIVIGVVPEEPSGEQLRRLSGPSSR